MLSEERRRVIIFLKNRDSQVTLEIEATEDWLTCFQSTRWESIKYTRVKNPGKPSVSAPAHEDF